MLIISIDDKLMPKIEFLGKNKASIKDLALIVFFLKESFYVAPLLALLNEQISKEQIEKLLQAVNSIDLKASKISNISILEAAKIAILNNDGDDNNEESETSK